MEPSPNPTPPAGERIERRTFFRWLTYGLGAVAAAVLAVPFVLYLFGARKRPEEWVKLGPVDKFPVDQTRLEDFVNPIRQPWDGMVARTGVFVRNQGKDAEGKEQFLVLGVNCAHLGCPVSWFPQSGLFLCPCHGGVYYADGSHASGPPPRGLFRCPWRVKDGQLEVRAPHYPTLHDTLEEA
jgi:Rieske Fe-S protein